MVACLCAIDKASLPRFRILGCWTESAASTSLVGNALVMKARNGRRTCGENRWRRRRKPPPAHGSVASHQWPVKGKECITSWRLQFEEEVVSLKLALVLVTSIGVERCITKVW